MTIEQSNCPSPQYRFKMNAECCDEVLYIYGPDPGQPPIRICYWTGAGLAAELTEWLPATPGLLPACKLLLAELEALLQSEDPQVRAEGELEAELIAGLRSAIGEFEVKPS